MSARGRFITLEGGEGVGKTTLAKHLRAHMEARGVEVVLTREPGGSPAAELLREALYGPSAPHWSPIPETLLLFAARAAHLEETIRPALARGAWVICDRFNDSTLAYQGVLGGVDQAFLSDLANRVIGADHPDLTFMLDLDPTLARSRAEQRGEVLTRYDSAPPAFHAGLRAAFLEIARSNPERCTVLDASMTPERLADEAFSTLAARLGLDRGRQS
jgi:dTMP kinase